jgi:hypothetical protein
LVLANYCASYKFEYKNKNISAKILWGEKSSKPLFKDIHNNQVIVVLKIVIVMIALKIFDYVSRLLYSIAGYQGL